MPRYRIEFSRDWIRGRWGFIDRFFYKLGGKESEPSRTENAWLLDFKGTPSALGQEIAERLEIRREDLKQFGTIFEITHIPTPGEERKRRRPARPARRLTAPST